MKIYIAISGFAYTLYHSAMGLLSDQWLPFLVIMCHLFVAYVLFTSKSFSRLGNYFVLAMSLVSLWSVSLAILWAFHFNVLGGFFFMALFTPFYFLSVSWLIKNETNRKNEIASGEL